MSSRDRADRYKAAILKRGYENMASITGISKATLVRIASGKTEPKISQVAVIAAASDTCIEMLYFGYISDQVRSLINSDINSVDGISIRNETLNIILGLEQLPAEDVRFIEKNVFALKDSYLKNKEP